MPNIIEVTVPMPTRSTREANDNGRSELHVCVVARDKDTGELGYCTLEMEPFRMPNDDSTVVVLKIAPKGR